MLSFLMEVLRPLIEIPEILEDPRLLLGNHNFDVPNGRRIVSLTLIFSLGSRVEPYSAPMSGFLPPNSSSSVESGFV